MKVDTTKITIETPRLILRGFTMADLNDFYEYASVPGVGEMAGWPYHKTIETSEGILRSFLEDKDVFAIFHKDESKVIGSLGLHESWAGEEDEYAHLKSVEIGYVLSKNFWGQGLVPEAVNAVIDYGFNTLGVEAFTCGHFAENNQSRRVVEKIGFKFVKHDKYYAKFFY
jgi:ribosomal-protein-alanine N-acetyltransferase